MNTPNFRPFLPRILKKMPRNEPKQAANFKEIEPENDLANFLLVHLTKSFSVNMAEQQQTGQHSPP